MLQHLWTCFRLPSDVLPESYSLLLQPDLEKGVFSGDVSIRLKVTSNRSWIAVHHKFLNISFTELLEASTSASLHVLTIHDYTEHEFWVLEMAQTIPPGEYILNMKFAGILTRGIIGFYRSTYTENGTQR